ncbi:MAG: N-acetylmuramoyl-L-alanine amidase [Clostridiales bacterium]|nr:N-acetylmuramoyl-L-alanine amidase [Clostridiales bacterium]
MSREERRAGSIQRLCRISDRYHRIQNKLSLTVSVAGMLLVAVLAMSGCASQKYPKLESRTVEAGTENREVFEQENPAETTAAVAESSLVAVPISRAAAMEACDETVYISADSVNVREMPDTDADVVTRLNRGTELRRTGQGDSWSRVIWQDAECYVASRYLTTEKPDSETVSSAAAVSGGTEIALDSGWTYAGFAKITSGRAVLYSSETANRKGKVVCVNAGHGTSGGSSVKTQCHPDGSAKVTGGTTAAGATTAVAVSGGMTFADGTAESKVTLALAKVLKEKLLARGYDVLMIRESEDVQLDNIARTVIANNVADCHLALHWDSTESDKGAFYMSVPDVSSYRSMEPVASHWQQHHALGESLIAGLKGAGVKIFSGGSMAMDLTQTSYSTIPSVDIELGDKVSDHSAAALETLAEGLADGLDNFFE